MLLMTVLAEDEDAAMKIAEAESRAYYGLDDEDDEEFEQQLDGFGILQTGGPSHG